MGAWEIVLIVFCAVFVIAVITTTVIKKKKGKCSCDCCNGNCSMCGKAKTDDKK